MSLKQRLQAKLHGSAVAAPAASDNTDFDEESEGVLEPNTAALTEGAPPAGSSGRVQPSGESPDPRPGRGISEGEVQNMPG